jgi:hypothetical protein
MRQFQIELSDLEMAFDSSGEMISYYLDPESGDVLSITDDENRLLEYLFVNYHNEKTHAINWETAFQEESISVMRTRGNRIQTQSRLVLAAVT